MVDTGSADDSAAVARGRARTIELGDNPGFGAASQRRRRAAAAAPVTVLLNPDVILLDGCAGHAGARCGRLRARCWCPDCSTATAASSDSAHPLPGTARALLPALVHPRAAARGACAWPPTRGAPTRPRRVGWAIAACVAAPTRLLLELGPFDPEQFLFYEDMDLCLGAPRAWVSHRAAIPAWRWCTPAGTPRPGVTAASPTTCWPGGAGEVVGRRLGRRALALDDAAQGATFATRAAGAGRAAPRRQPRARAAGGAEACPADSGHHRAVGIDSCYSRANPFSLHNPRRLQHPRFGQRRPTGRPASGARGGPARRAGPRLPGRACVAPSACSWRCARSGPRPTSSPRSTTKRGPRATSRTGGCRPRSSRCCARAGRPSGRCCRSTPPPSRASTCPGYDVVVSSSSAWAHGVICDPGAVHVCYCHNPFRFAWNERHSTLADRRDPVTRALGRALFRRWRGWDWMAAQRVDRYLTNSETTRSRIASYFGRERARGVPARARRAVRARRAGRPLPGAVRAGLAQADRRGGARPSRSWMRRWWWSATARRLRDLRRLASPQRALRGPRVRRRGGRADGHLPRVRGHGHRGVRDRRGRGAGRGPAGDRPPRRRRAGDRDRGRDRVLLGGRAAASWPRPSAASTRWPWTRRRAWTTPAASRSDVFRQRLLAEVADAVGSSSRAGGRASARRSSQARDARPPTGALASRVRADRRGGRPRRPGARHRRARGGAQRDRRRARRARAAGRAGRRPWAWTPSCTATTSTPCARIPGTRGRRRARDELWGLTVTAARAAPAARGCA